MLSCLRLAVCLTLAAALVRCQQPSPLKGRGFPPEEGTDVFLSVIVDRLIAIDDVNYRFEAMLYFELSWRDSRAQRAYLNATASAGSDPSYNNGNGCIHPCSSLYDWTPGAPCCDGVFLPTLEFVNARGFSQDRPDRWRVAVNTELGNDAVVWWAYVLGQWYAPMQFKAFPFDRQKLLVQMQYGNRNTSSPVRFIASSTGTQLYRPSVGDDLSGWTLQGLEIVPFNFTERGQNLIRSGGTSYSDPLDPWPLNPQNASATAPFNSQLWTEGVNVIITVDRISTYYIIVAIVPIVVNVLLCLLVFFISPRHLDTRLGVVVTMFLSLTAIQFVVSSVLPSSSTVVPTQQLVIVSYVVLALIAITSIWVYFIVTAEKHHTKRQQSKQASRAFTHRWTTFVRGLGAAPAAGVDAAAAAIAAAPSSLQQAEEAAGEQAGGQGAAGRGEASGSDAGSDGSEPGMELGQGERSVRFAGMGICAQSSNGEAGSSDDDEEDAKSYVSTSSDNDSKPASRPPASRSRPSKRQLGAAGVSALATTAPLAAAPPGPRAAPSLALGGNAVLSEAAGPGSQSGHSGWAGGSGSATNSSGGADKGAGVDLEAGRGERQRRGGSGGGMGGGGMSGSMNGGSRGSRANGGSPRGGKGRRLRGACGRWRWRCCHRAASWDWWRELGRWPGQWLRLQHLRYKETVRECQHSREYAEHLAAKIDRMVFWGLLASYTAAIILIFAIGAQNQPEVIFVGG